MPTEMVGDRCFWSTVAAVHPASPTYTWMNRRVAGAKAGEFDKTFGMDQVPARRSNGQHVFPSQQPQRDNWLTCHDDFHK